MEKFGLRDLYRENPYERRIKVAGQMMGSSGFAKPLIALMMGRDTASAEEWDKGRADQGVEMLTKQSEMAYAEKMLDNVINVSKVDAAAATQILQAEAESNKYLSKFKGIQFNAPTTKDNWVTVTGGDGQAYQIYLPGLAEVTESPASFSDEHMSKIVIPIGGPKPTTAPKTEDFQVGNKTVKRQWNEKTGKWDDIPGASGPKWDPNKGGGGSRSKEDVLKDIRITASQIASRIGDQSIVDAIVKTSIKDPKIQQTLADAKTKDPYIKTLEDVLTEYQSEYQQVTGKPFGDKVSTGGSKDTKGQTSAELSGNKVTYGGSTYPLNPDGTVTINGKRYKVNK